MHDPDVVAFTIRRPWPDWPPRNVRGPVPEGCNPNPRWDWGYNWRRSDPGKRGWKNWRPSPFVTVAGFRFYFPSLVTVWHHEPGDADSGDVCKHWKRVMDDKALVEIVDAERALSRAMEDGGDAGAEVAERRLARLRTEGRVVSDQSWRFHVRHWRIQVPALQGLRRRLLTRCAWCGGRSTRQDPVNVSAGWDTPRGKWWEGEPDVYHHWCSSAHSAWHTCTCSEPGLRLRPDGSLAEFGPCRECGRFRPWRVEPWRAKQIEDWRRDVPYGTHPTREAHERAVATYEQNKTAQEAL